MSSKASATAFLLCFELFPKELLLLLLSSSFGGPLLDVILAKHFPVNMLLILIDPAAPLTYQSISESLNAYVYLNKISLLPFPSIH